MKESVLDVLMYLFETFADADLDPEPDRDLLRGELARAGFDDPHIDRAFEWLDELNESEYHASDQRTAGAMRVFSEAETQSLGVEAVGFLMRLRETGILDPDQLELVLDRLMALGDADIDLEQVKWIVLIVLYSQSDQQVAYARMEDLVFEDEPASLH